MINLFFILILISAYAFVHPVNRYIAESRAKCRIRHTLKQERLFFTENNKFDLSAIGNQNDRFYSYILKPVPGVKSLEVIASPRDATLNVVRVVLIAVPTTDGTYHMEARLYRYSPGDRLDRIVPSEPFDLNKNDLFTGFGIR